MAEFKVIETQEQFDAAIKERIARAEAKVAEKYAAHISPEDFQKKTDEFNQQITALNESLNEEKNKHAETDKTISGLQKQIKDYETASVKTKIAAEFGLPYEIASRLMGETEDEIRKDATNLQSMLNKNKVSPLHNPNHEGENTERAALAGMLRDMNGGK